MTNKSDALSPFGFTEADVKVVGQKDEVSGSNDYDLDEDVNFEESYESYEEEAITPNVLKQPTAPSVE